MCTFDFTNFCEVRNFGSRHVIFVTKIFVSFFKQRMLQTHVFLKAYADSEKTLASSFTCK